MSPPRANAPVVIVGAGITGLVLAWQLRQRGTPVCVLEASARAGGAIRTVREGEWLFETGPNTVLLKDRRVQQLVTKTLGLGEAFLFADGAAGNRFVVRGGVPLPLPTSVGAFLRTPLFSSRAKLRLLREPFIRPFDTACGEESVADFVLRRLGPEFLDYAINPFIAGVYAGDPAQLSVDAGFPRLRELEQRYGSLIGGQLRGARERRAAGRENPDRARIFSFTEGLQTLPEALAAKLGDALRLGHAVQAVEPVEPSADAGDTAGAARWRLRYSRVGAAAADVSDARGELMEASRVVMTVGAPQLAAIEGPWQAIDPGSIRQPPVAVVNLGFARAQVAHPLGGFGLLVPEVERRRILGCLFPSTLFPGRAPADHVLLTSFVGGTRQPKLVEEQDDAALAHMVREELAALLGVRGNPVITHISRWPQAIPQYELGHRAWLEQLDALESAHPGLQFAGNYRGGISVSDRLLAALDALPA